MFVNTKYLTLKFFFSASSFYPSRQLDTDTSTPYPDNEDLTDTCDSDTEVESEGDWLTELEVPEPMNMELSRRTSSKTMEAMLIEVSTYFLILIIKAYKYLLAFSLEGLSCYGLSYSQCW